MSFFLRPFHRANASKASKKQRRRASFSDVNFAPSTDTFPAVQEEFLNEDDSEDTTQSASHSSVDPVVVNNNSMSMSSGGKSLRRQQHSPQRQRHHHHNKKQHKKALRRASTTDDRHDRHNNKKDRSRKTNNNRANLEEKFMSDLNELEAIESFVKKMTASSQGEKLLQEHLKSRRTTVGHGLEPAAA